MRASLLLSCAFVCAPLFALRAQEAEQPIELDAILVNGVQVRNCLPVAEARSEGDMRPLCLGRGVGRADLPGATITESQFNRLPTGARANAIVKRLPTITTGGGPGEDKDARIMGLDKEYTRTVVDGLQLPDGGEKREFNLDRFPVAMLGGVEVLRGKTADMEADGIAGKVILHTKDIPEELTRSISISGGKTSDGIGNYGLSAHVGGMITPDFGAQAVVNFGRDGASKTKVKTTLAGAVERTVEEKPQPTKEFMGDVMISGDLGTFRIKPIYLDQTEEKSKDVQKLTAAGAFNGAESGYEEKRKRTRGLSVSWAEDFGVVSLEARLSRMQGNEDKTATTATTNASRVVTNKVETEDKVDLNDTLELDADIPMAFGAFDGKLRTGFAYRDKSRDKTKVSSGVVATGKETYELDESYRAAYVMGDFAVGEAFTLKPGVRFEAVDLDGYARGTNTRSTGTSRDLLPSLAATWQISDTLKLSGTVGRSVNRPKFDMLAPFSTTSGSTVTVGNPDLDPARANTYDLDLSYTGGAVDLVAGLWHRNIKDVIEEGVATGNMVGSRTELSAQNVGDGTVTGISFTERVALADLGPQALSGFTLGANQNWAESKLHVFATGKTRQFKEQPKFWGDVFVEWVNPSERLALMAALNYTGKLHSVGDSGTEWRDSEKTIDLRVAYNINDLTQVYLMGENVTESERVNHAADGSITVESGPALVSFGLTKRF